MAMTPVGATVLMHARKLSVLVVEDDALVRMNTAAMLEDLGHQVRQVGSGAEAIQFAASGQRLGLLVTDQGMPGRSGTQLAAALRASRPAPRILIDSAGRLGMPSTGPSAWRD
jgi:CheY-like chemotaxis protein